MSQFATRCLITAALSFANLPSSTSWFALLRITLRIDHGRKRLRIWSDTIVFSTPTRGTATDGRFLTSPEAVAVKGNLQTNNPLVLLGAAEAGEGIVVLPRFLAADALAEGRLIGLLSEHTTLRMPILAIYPHRGLVPAKTAVFVDMVAAHLQRVLAPVTSEPPRRSISRTPGESQPVAAVKSGRRTPALAARA